MASKIKVDQLETADGSGTIALQNQLSGMTTASLPALGSAQMPTGSVLQVVQGSYSTTMSTTSNSTFVSTGASITITPTSSSSKILVMFNQHIAIEKQNGDQGAGFAIKRGSTTVWSTPVPYAFYHYSGTDSVYVDGSMGTGAYLHGSINYNSNQNELITMKYLRLKKKICTDNIVRN